MAYFNGLKILSNIRKADAKLVSASLNKFGKTFAFESPWNADGFSTVDVTATQAPLLIKKYLEGDTDMTMIGIPSNVDSLRVDALSAFPNLEEIYLFKNNAIVVIDDDLSYLISLTKIYVPSALLDEYKSAYPDLETLFDVIIEDYVLTIPYVGESTLTIEYLDEVLGMLSSAERSSVEKVVIPTDFTQASADYIAWNYPFSSYLPNLNDNIWYVETKYDFTTLTILGSGTLTSAVVDSAIQGVSLRINSITKVIVPIDFTTYESGAFTKLSDNTYIPNLRYLETTYKEDAMELDLQSDIVSKIISIGKTLDEALVYAKTFSKYTQYNRALDNDNNIIICPPTTVRSSSQFINNCSNLVYIDKIKTSGFGINYFLGIANNLVEIKELKFTSSSWEWSANQSIFGGAYGASNAIKRLNIDFSVLSSTNMKDISFTGSNFQNNLTSIIFNGLKANLSFPTPYVPTLSKACIIGLINSLGIPSVQKTLNLGKQQNTNAIQGDNEGLQAIQNLYDKNYVLSPTPSAFTFEIGGNTYSCDFGMTWAEWCASAYNIDGYLAIGNNVYSSDYSNIIKLNGVNVTNSSMVRYGDEYELANATNIALINAESGETALTNTIVARELANYSDLTLIETLVVSTDFNLESVCVILSDYDLSALTNLNENIYYGSHTCKGVSFATDDEETIKLSAWLDSNCPYEIGDTRSVVYNNTTYTLRICDNTANRYELTNYSGKYNKFVVEFVELVGLAQMNSSDTTDGGWISSRMKTTTMPNIYNNLPSDLKAVISQVDVEPSSEDYVFIPSEQELNGTTAFNQYKTTPSSRIKFRLNYSSADYWWIRTVSSSTQFRFVTGGGSFSSDVASHSLGCSVFFCI